MGTFHHFLLYNCPPPGKIKADKAALVGDGLKAKGLDFGIVASGRGVVEVCKIMGFF
jgi:hypothetical protein